MTSVEKAERALARAIKARDIVRARRQILCRCGKRHAIGKLQLIITHDYQEPHGCSGGDYWSEGEWQFECPDGGGRNRILFDDYDVEYELRDRVGVAARPTFQRIYRALFASKIDEYSRHSHGWNNYYVDRHRARFELPARRPVSP